jgi:hypothetical protein
MILEELFGLAVPPNVYSSKVTDFICGCEYEIEDIKKISLAVQDVFTIEDDHSLRNGGKEFKTPPCSFDEAVANFDFLHKNLTLGEDPFSDRTSIHVHVNVSKMMEAQVRQLVLCYALIEPIIFEFVGPVRKGSIFCVPLNYTFLPSKYSNSFSGLRQIWHKYTAFNIVPAGPNKDNLGLGTVEFRHLYGTDNRETFHTWLTILRELYLFIATQPDFNIIKSLEKDNFINLARQISPTLTKDYTYSQLAELMKDSQLDVKLSAGGI